jgi:hypothetical protein
MRRVFFLRRIVTFIAVCFMSALSAVATQNIPLRNWRVPFPSAQTGRSGLTKQTLGAISGSAAFVAVTPCRVVDTRNPAGPYGGPAFTGSETRTYDIPASPCLGIPVAAAYSLNFGIVNFSGGGGFVSAYPSGTVRPGTSTVTFGKDPAFAVANAAIVPASIGLIDVYASETTQLIIDINGYFIEPVISGVSAGAGLTGGGTTGNVQLSVNFAPSGAMNGSAITVARSDHRHYLKTVIISPTGTATQNGTALNFAVGAITDNTTFPYLIKIEPGTYDLGTSRLTMKANVDIEGSGEGVTLISGSATSNNANAGVVISVSNTELRFLTVECYGGNAHCTGIYTGNSSGTISHVTALAVSGTLENIAIYNDLTGGAPILHDVTATANGTGSTNFGVLNRSTSPEMLNVTATASAGNINYGVYNDAAMTTAPGTMVNVNATGSGGSLNYGVYNNTFTMSTAQRSMFNVRATASGPAGSTNVGLYHLNSNGSMVGITASATGGTNAYGMILRGPTSLTLDTFSTSASNSTADLIGVYIDNSSPVLTNGTVRAGGTATNNAGIYVINPATPGLTNVGVGISNGTVPTKALVLDGSHSGTIVIHRSTLRAFTNSVSVTSASTQLRIGASQLEGTVSPGGGTLTCAASYNGAFGPLSATCN